MKNRMRRLDLFSVAASVIAALFLSGFNCSAWIFYLFLIAMVSMTEPGPAGVLVIVMFAAFPYWVLFTSITNWAIWRNAVRDTLCQLLDLLRKGQARYWRVAD